MSSVEQPVEKLVEKPVEKSKRALTEYQKFVIEHRKGSKYSLKEIGEMWRKSGKAKPKKEKKKKPVETELPVEHVSVEKPKRKNKKKVVETEEVENVQ